MLIETVYSNENKFMDLYSVYVLPYSDPLELNNLLKFEQENYIYFGGFNAHHQS